MNSYHFGTTEAKKSLISSVLNIMREDFKILEEKYPSPECQPQHLSESKPQVSETFTEPVAKVNKENSHTFLSIPKIENHIPTENVSLPETSTTNKFILARKNNPDKTVGEFTSFESFAKEIQLQAHKPFVKTNKLIEMEREFY